MPMSNVSIGSLGRPNKDYHSYCEFSLDGPESSSSSGSYSELTFGNKSPMNQVVPHSMGTTKYELEDYIYEMECKQNEKIDTNEEDVFVRLDGKEKDLILAAELGKALLERNELLVHQNERITEDYSQKLEILEQDKHILRRKLTAKENEHELKIQELAVDLQCVKQDLEDEQDSLRQTDRDNRQIIDELTEQNQRLTSELKEAAKREEQMNTQLKQVRDQFNIRRSNITDQVSTLEVLREEINLLSEKKSDLEKRIESLANEREGLVVTLDESTDQIVMLERQSREREQQMRSNQKDLEDLRHNNLSLTDRLEAISRNSNSPSIGHTSLMNEMDMSDQEVSRPHSHPSLPEDLIELDEDIECDNPIMSPISDTESLKKLRSEAVESVGLIRVMADQIRHRRRNSLTSLSTNSSDDFSLNHMKPGTLTSSVKELQGLVREILRKEAKGHCNACGRSGSEGKIQLEQEVHKVLETLDKLNIELNDTKDNLKTKTAEAEHFEQQIILKEAQQKAVEEERDNVKSDLANTHIAKEELIKKAWDMRDNAVARKNACEIQLAKTRIDVMQINSQLLEAIQQKIELSQQLEQWQVDMQQLLDDQMKKKLSRLETSAALAYQTIKGHGSDSDSSTNDGASGK